MIDSGIYTDRTSKITYKLKSPIILDSKEITLINGENGVGKTRFLEGILLKEIKKQKRRILYFGQDLENQILTFELINIVKKFITTLKQQGNFFKAILFNNDSHKDIEIDFDSNAILNPDKEAIKQFILTESHKYKYDVLVLDEVDKYFSNCDEFNIFLDKLEVKRIFLISHIIENGNYTVLNFKNSNGEVIIE